MDNTKKKLKDTATELDNAKKKVDEFGSKTLSSVARLKQIKNELNNFKGTEQRFQALTLEGAKLADQIQKTNQRIAVLASSTRHIQALTSAFSGLVGGFTAVQGAQALFGQESENVNKALIRLNGSMALLQGVQAAVATVTEQSAAKTVIASAAQKAYAFVVGESTGALKAFRIGLAATGIGLAVIAIGELVAHWDELKEAIGLAGHESKDFYDAEVRRLDFLIKKNELLGKSTDELRKKSIEAQLHAAEAAGDEGKQLDLLNEKKLLSIEIDRRRAKEGFEFEKEHTQRLIELAVEGSQEQLRLKQHLVDVERSILTAGEKVTQQELIEILDVAEKRKQKLELEFAAETLRKKRELLGEPVEPVDLDAFDKKKQDFLDALQAIADKMDEIDKSDAVVIRPEVDTSGLKALREELENSKDEFATFKEVVHDNKDAIIQSAEESLQALIQLSADGSKAQIAFAGVAIFANQAKAIAAAIAAATEAAGATGGLSLPVLIPSFVSIALSTFAQVNSLLAQAKAAQGNVQAFAEGEVNIHRPGETRGRDSIPAVLMPGESVIRTDRTKQYNQELQAIQHGNLEDLIRVNYVEPALALKALDHAANDSKQVDYSDRFYRQYLATGEGNLTNKRAVKILASIDRKLSDNKKRYH